MRAYDVFKSVLGAPKRALALACILAAAASLICPSGASAATTIDEFTFTQGGYTSPGLGGTAVLSGTFIGTVEPGGLIEKADLSSLQTGLSFGGLIDATLSLPGFFSFNTNGGSSSLDFAGHFTDFPNQNTTICLGAAAAFGGSLTGVNCGPGGVNGYDGLAATAAAFSTQELPVVNLISSVTTVPEASTWAMMALGFAGLGALGYGRTGRRLAATTA